MRKTNYIERLLNDPDGASRLFAVLWAICFLNMIVWIFWSIDSNAFNKNVTTAFGLGLFYASALSAILGFLIISIRAITLTAIPIPKGSMIVFGFTVLCNVLTVIGALVAAF